MIDIISDGTSEINRSIISLISICCGPRIIETKIIVEQSNRYLNNLYVRDDGWSISGNMLPNNDIGRASPIRPIDKFTGMFKIIIDMGSIIIVPIMCENHPYRICPLNPLITT